MQRGTIDTTLVTTSAVPNMNNANYTEYKKIKPGSTNGNSAGYFRFFKLFPYLNDDIKFTILSYVADAPFEKLPENYPISTLTHYMPRVNRKFREFAESDLYWRPAVERLATKEPHLCREALNQICMEAKKIQVALDSIHRDGSVSVVIDSEGDDVMANGNYEESIQQLIDRTYRTLQRPTYKFLYSQIINKYFRVKGLVYEQEGHVTIGEQYSITLNEPKYRLMMNEVMKNHSIDERRNGVLVKQEAMFIHANRIPVECTQPAVLVQVVQCNMHGNGTVDVLVQPVGHVWIEKINYQPNSFGLMKAQCLRMGQRVSSDMNHLARQEVLAQIMDNMTRDFEDAFAPTSDANVNATTNSVSADDASFLSNQYEVTDDDGDDVSISSSSDDSWSEDDGDFSTDSSDSNFDTEDDSGDD